MNYLQYVYEAVNAASSVPVYSYAAPQGVAEDFIVFTLNGIDVSETKDQYKAERLSITLFLHFADSDEAQNELSEIRHHLQHYPRVIPLYRQEVLDDSGDIEGEDCAAAALGVASEVTFTQAWMESLQVFYNEQDESLILSADFTFLINY